MKESRQKVSFKKFDNKFHHIILSYELVANSRNFICTNDDPQLRSVSSMYIMRKRASKQIAREAKFIALARKDKSRGCVLVCRQAIYDFRARALSWIRAKYRVQRDEMRVVWRKDIRKRKKNCLVLHCIYF